MLTKFCVCVAECAVSTRTAIGFQFVYMTVLVTLQTLSYDRLNNATMNKLEAHPKKGKTTGNTSEVCFFFSFSDHYKSARLYSLHL